MNTNKKKGSQWRAVDPDQFCWETRAKVTVFKSSKQSLWSSTDESYHCSHYIFNQHPCIELQNAKLNLPNFTGTSPFNREVIIHALVGILLWNKQIKSEIKYQVENSKIRKTKLL